MLNPCIQHAAAAYDVPAIRIEAVIKARGAGVGPMGIPPQWMPILARVGFPADLGSDACAAIAAGTWILAYEQYADRRRRTTSIERPPFPVGGEGKALEACIVDAADQERIPVTLFRGILATEGGHVGQIHRNSNGSYDMGPAQINSTWLPQLASMGITRDQVINDGCLNVHIGAWVLKQAIAGADPSSPAEFWRHVGDYNSRTPAFNARYVAEVWTKIEAQSHNASDGRTP